MKVIILAGGLGSRMGDETNLVPKPMIEIGGKPILWHIMKIYSSYGFNDFVILLGHKGYIIKEYFANYFLHNSNITVNLKENNITYHESVVEPWNITLIDTGSNTMTGGRLKRVASIIGNETFMLTYGDGLADVNIKELLAFHKQHGKAITITGVQPDGRFGALEIDPDNKVTQFTEKLKGDSAWINGGFFVCNPKVLDYITSDTIVFEEEPLNALTSEGELYTYKHTGFWKCMDTLRDKQYLNAVWENGTAPWRNW